jgi:hypothetical protein
MSLKVDSKQLLKVSVIFSENGYFALTVSSEEVGAVRVVHVLGPEGFLVENAGGEVPERLVLHCGVAAEHHVRLIEHVALRRSSRAGIRRAAVALVRRQDDVSDGFQVDEELKSVGLSSKIPFDPNWQVSYLQPAHVRGLDSLLHQSLVLLLGLELGLLPANGQVAPRIVGGQRTNHFNLKDIIMKRQFVKWAICACAYYLPGEVPGADDGAHVGASTVDGESRRARVATCHTVVLIAKLATKFIEIFLPVLTRYSRLKLADALKS